MAARTTLVGVVIVLLLVACAQTPPRTWDLPPGAKALRVNGYEMAYVERGAGQPIVLVHGALSDFRFFAAAMEPLSEKYRVIAVDSAALLSGALGRQGRNLFPPTAYVGPRSVHPRSRGRPGPSCRSFPWR